MPHVKGNKFKPKIAERTKSVEMPSVVTESNELKCDEGAAAHTLKKKNGKKPRVYNLKTVVMPAPKGKGDSMAASTSNWSSLRAAMDEKKAEKRKQASLNPGGNGSLAGERKRAKPNPKTPSTSENQDGLKYKASRSTGFAGSAQLTRVLALDCEMVGTGPNAVRDALARVSIVNSAGAIVYDSFVSSSEKVTDYRTRWSGVRPSDLRGAPDAQTVRTAIGTLIRGRVLVGHALKNDLDVLEITHPHTHIRDTSKYPPFMMKSIGGRPKPRKLRQLAQEQLGIEIQSGEHDPIEDARTALALYQKHKKDWERQLAKGGPRKDENLGARASGSKTRLQKGNSAIGAQKLAELATRDYMADL